MSDENLKDPKKPYGPVKVGSYTLTVDPDLCIGAATCIAIAPQTYTLDSEAKAIILDTAEQEGDDIQLEAAKGCPVAAIYVDDEQGNRVYPN
jgi:ferredoxin